MKTESLGAASSEDLIKEKAMEERDYVKDLMKKGGRIYLGSKPLSQEAARLLLERREKIERGEFPMTEMPREWEEAEQESIKSWNRKFGRFPK